MKYALKTYDIWLSILSIYVYLLSVASSSISFMVKTQTSSIARKSNLLKIVVPLLDMIIQATLL